MLLVLITIAQSMYFFVFNYTVKSGTFHLLQTPDQTALKRNLTGSLLFLDGLRPFSCVACHILAFHYNRASLQQEYLVRGSFVALLKRSFL